jgi:hypothetical protein
MPCEAVGNTYAAIAARRHAVARSARIKGQGSELQEFAYL